LHPLTLTAAGNCCGQTLRVNALWAPAQRRGPQALRHLREGRESTVSNIGYGRGYSVLEVIEAVKQVSGVDFPVRLRERRAGDPAILVASSARARQLLQWTPHHDDLPRIIADALRWERALRDETRRAVA
jgi:UDP-glucose 4-epimerase